MVAKLTHGVRKFDDVQPQMRAAIPTLHEVTGQLIPMIDADTSAFNEYMEGLRMPRNTEEQQRAEKEENAGRSQDGDTCAAHHHAAR